MTGSYSITGSETFSIIHARHIASKVATDLKRIQRFYNIPGDAMINSYEAELVVLLKYNFLDNVIYGFKRNEKWTDVAVRYKALPDGSLSEDNDPGKIKPGLDVTNATFHSFLSYNSRWYQLSAAEQAAIESECPFQRVTGNMPPPENGSWVDDLNYAAGGRGLGRATIRR
jgi:hypothetical protein